MTRYTKRTYRITEIQDEAVKRWSKEARTSESGIIRLALTNVESVLRNLKIIK